jgi:hypothetical protein
MSAPCFACGKDRKDKNESPATSKKEDKKNGMAILVSFPDKTADTPEWLKKIGKNIGVSIPNESSAGHAGIVIINKETGETNYFDFGRYDQRSKELGKRPIDKGIVRSKKTVIGLKTPYWNDNMSNIENVKNIINNLHQKSFFKSYGNIYGVLATDLDYDSMLTQAQEEENEGYKDFGGYLSGVCGDATYCAKFARCVGASGGINFGFKTGVTDFSGIGNVMNVYNNYKNPIIRGESSKRKK